MTVLSMVGALRRFWIMALCGVILAVGSALALRATEPLYFARVSVYFTLSQSSANPNTLARQQAGIVDLVAVAQRRLTKRLPPPSLASPTVSVLDEGMVQGVRVDVPNTGGQWDTSFNSPYLDLQVVDRDPARVAAITTSMLQEIDKTLVTIQNEENVIPEDRVVTNLSPPPSVEVHAARGPVTRGAAILAILILAVTMALADAIDRTYPRPERRSPVSVSPTSRLQEAAV